MVRTYFGLLMLAIACSSCKSLSESTTRKKEFKHIYLNQFRLAYFRQLLTKSYNYSAAINQIVDADHSGFTEAILTEQDWHLIDSLTTLDNRFLQIDSANGVHRAEGAQGKRPLGYIMDKLRSKWLDSLARQRWKVNAGSILSTD